VLTAAASCADSYRVAEPPTRRLLNQGFFEKLYVAEDGTVERADLTEPFAALLTSDTRPGRLAAAEPADVARGNEKAIGRRSGRLGVSGRPERRGHAPVGDRHRRNPDTRNTRSGRSDRVFEH
jgi:hypothetical protein